MTAFTTYPCTPQGDIVECDPNSPFILVEQTSGETYMGDRRFVLHRAEIGDLVAALEAAR
ncbi:hypothetical protein BAMBUS_05160 [Brevundimonas phage vB_BpoS-Bambus]|nr:hypothetical protein BAMBUS_05160 [Brevundimonas phage vB_BpoS-Bambus]